MSNVDVEHYKHLKESAIADDIIEFNFHSWDANDPTDLDDVFSLLIEDPDYLNSGGLAGTKNQKLANVLRGGGWVFDGHSGVSVKPDNPRKDKEGKKIKYEATRGHQQLFIPRISVRVATSIATKLGVDRSIDDVLDIDDIDSGFWDWYLSTSLPLIITEGCKKACAVVSSGYPAIALNGVYGWGSNDRDMFGNVEVDNSGDRIKTIVPALMPFILDREIVMAFDRDSNPKTIAYVRRALQRFTANIADISSSVSQLKWTVSKGIDDLIVAKGVKNLDRIYNKRMPVKPVEEKSDKKPTAWQLSPKIALNVYGGTMRYDVEFKQYWEYKDGLWKQCADEYIFALVKTYLDTITEDYPTRLVTETITFARGSILVPEWIEADNTRFIPFKNGVLEVETMQLLPHSPSYGFRWQMPRDYSVVSTGWNNIEKFLNELSFQNVDLKNILLAFCNATLMGRSNLHKFLHLAGSGGNGKGVFMSLLQSLVGVENTHTTSLASLCENRFEPANIKNKRLVLCDDEDKKPDSLTVFKSATGGGDITCEYKGKQSVNFKFGGIFVVAANQAIFKGENHEAMKRRKVEFPCEFKPLKKDEELIDRLVLELPSFTTYVLSLDPDWVKRTIRESSSVEAVAKLARETSILEDSVAAFFHHRLVFDTESSIQSSLMYKDYESYCSSNNLKPLGGNKFPKMLLEFCNDSMKLGVVRKEGRSCNSFVGLRLATFADDEASDQECGGKSNVCGGKSGGNGGSQEPLFRKSVEGVEANLTISYVGEVEEKNININTRSEGLIGVFASTPSTETLKPIPTVESSDVEANPQSSTPSTILKPGDRVKGIHVDKSGIVDLIGRHPTLKKSTAQWARVIMDGGKEWWVELDVITKITEPNAT